MIKKVIKTNELEQYLYPDGIANLDQFMKEVVNKSDGFVKMEYLNNDAETNPFFVHEDIKTVYVNFNNMTTLEEDEVMLMSDAEFEDHLAPFADEICENCVFDGNPGTGCDRILRKRDKINILEESCFLFADMRDFDEDEIPDFPAPLDSDRGKIFPFKRKDEDED